MATRNSMGMNRRDTTKRVIRTNTMLVNKRIYKLFKLKQQVPMAQVRQQGQALAAAARQAYLYLSTAQLYVRNKELDAVVSQLHDALKEAR